MTVGTRDLGRWSRWLSVGSGALLGMMAAVLPARAEIQPLKLSFAPEDESVYAPPVPAREDQGANLGGVNLDLSFSFLSDYIYRGVNHSDLPGRTHKPNVQFEGTVSFNTGKLPHPFVGIFANIFDSDPVSRFQEIRPFAGVEWTVRPITLDAGVNSYIYPEREAFNTSEVWLKLALDDSVVFRTQRPLFTPYLYAAYDYDKNKGFYLEAGVSHDFVVEDYDLTFTVLADVAYISHFREQFIFVGTQTSGFQHYDAGLIATYQLNNLLKVSKRFGEIDLKGYLYYTDGIGAQILHAESTVWGGAGLQFKY